MPIPSGGLINKYDFLDPACYPGSGTTINDLVGSLDLNITGSPTYDSTQGSLTWNGLGVGAYSAFGSYVNTTTTFTVSIWVRINDASVSQLIFNNGNRAGAMSGYSSFFDGTGSDLIDFGGNNVWGMASGSALSQDQWYNLTYTLDGGINEGKIYINGVLSSTSGNGSVSYGVNDFLALGGVGSSTGSPTLQNKSSYGVVLFYNTVLNATQVGDIYNSYFGRFNTGKVYLNASEPASAVAPYTTWSDLSNSYDFTMYSPSFTAATSSTPAYYSFPSRSFTTPVSVYGEYNGTPAITTEATWTGYFWVRRNANHGSFTQNRLSIFANGREDLISASNGWSYGTYNNPNAANDNIVIEAAGLGVFDSGDPMPNAEWVNIAYIRDSSNNINWYLDGAYLGQTAFTGYTTPADGMWISRTAGSFFSWMGDISIIREYDYSLTGTQLLSLINFDRENYIGFPTAVHEYDAADPASYPGSGSTLSDIGTATAIDLTINDATFNATNDSFTLDGTLSSYIRSANSLAGFDIGANNFSIQMWFKYNALTAQPPYNIFLQIGSRSGIFSGFTFSTFSGEFTIGSPGVADYPTGFYPTIDQWYQVTMTVDSSDNVILYVDSASEYTNTISFVAPANILAMGDNGIQTDQVADASVGPLLIYDRVLSPAEITTYYNSTVARFFPPPPPAGGNVGGRTFGQGFAG